MWWEEKLCRFRSIDRCLLGLLGHWQGTSFSSSLCTSKNFRVFLVVELGVQRHFWGLVHRNIIIVYFPELCSWEGFYTRGAFSFPLRLCLCQALFLGLIGSSLGRRAFTLQSLGLHFWHGFVFISHCRHWRQ